MAQTHPYAHLLGDQDPLDVLAETRDEVPRVAQALGADGLLRTYAPGKWTASQVLAHLADSEIGLGFRVRQMLSEPELEMQTMDENKWARFYDGVNALDAAVTFKCVRDWNLVFFRMLNKEDLAIRAMHPARGLESVETVIRTIAGHTLNHLGQLKRIWQETSDIERLLLPESSYPS